MITINGKKIPVKLYKTKYKCNNATAILAEFTYDGQEFVETITVNLSEAKMPKPNLVFIDVNNFPEILEDLDNSTYAERWGVNYVQSGFCRYPIYKFDLRKLPRWEGNN